MDLELGDWPVSGDFLLVRIAAGGELVDLTDTDVRCREACSGSGRLLGLDYILHR